MTSPFCRWLLGATLSLGMCVAFAARAEDPPPPPPPPTIAIDFDFDGKVQNYKVKKSTLSAAERAAVVKAVQGEYDDAFGPGVITVGEGKVGKVVVVVDGTPPKKPGFGYGTHGSTQAGQPSVVFELAFQGFTRAELVIGIEETVAHEAAHALGQPGHHGTKANPDKMTDGRKVDDATRKKGGRKFTDKDVELIKKALKLASAEQKGGFTPGDLGVYRGGVLATTEVPDEFSLESYLTFAAPPGFAFGYISEGNDFIDQGESFDPGETYAFFYTSGQNLAVRTASGFCALSDPCGAFELSDVNPDNPRVFSKATLTFVTPDGTATIDLDSTVWRTTGGFTRGDPSLVPEPATWLLLILGMGAAGSLLRRHRVGEGPAALALAA